MPASSLLSSTSSPTGIAIDGTYIYWADNASGRIGRAKLDTCCELPNANFITGVNDPWGLAVAAVPESGTGLLVIAGLIGLAGWRRRATT